MQKEFQVRSVVPNRPDGLVLLVQAKSLNKAVKKLRLSTEFQLPAGQYVIREVGNADNYVSIALMPMFVTHLCISQKESSIIDGYLQAKTTEEFQHEDDTIIHTAVFPDGKQMDIKCCGAQDESSWTEAVLFDRNGCELCHSEVCDGYDGEWELEYRSRRYVAIVHVHAEKK